MNMPHRFLQIHTLTSYPAALLNRDDAGFAKRIPFGSATRTRISSQCLKRHWRVFDGDPSLATIQAPDTVRSRVAFERYVVAPLVEDGITAEVARAAVEKLVSELLGSEAKQKKQASRRKTKSTAKDDASDDAMRGEELVKTKQVTVLGRPELDYLCSLAREACAGAKEPAAAEKAITERLKNKKALKKNIEALHSGTLEAGLGAALFGRMVTGDILARTDAAVHVAHSFTVHTQQSEGDYFSAIDDLVREEGEQGSGHINASELTSGLFYGYCVVDLRQLANNLGDDGQLTGEVVDRLVRIVATVSPGAKLGSTAPYAYSHLVLLELGCAQPRTLANAFLQPVPTTGDVADNAYRSLSEHLADLDAMYGKTGQRAHSGLRTKEHFEALKPLNELAEWAKRLAVSGVTK